MGQTQIYDFYVNNGFMRAGTEQKGRQYSNVRTCTLHVNVRFEVPKVEIIKFIQRRGTARTLPH